MSQKSAAHPRLCGYRQRPRKLTETPPSVHQMNPFIAAPQSGYSECKNVSADLNQNYFLSLKVTIVCHTLMDGKPVILLFTEVASTQLEAALRSVGCEI